MKWSRAGAYKLRRRDEKETRRYGTRAQIVRPIRHDGVTARRRRSAFYRRWRFIGETGRVRRRLRAKSFPDGERRPYSYPRRIGVAIRPRSLLLR